MTANSALKELLEEGLVVRVQGAGSFVGKPKNLSETDYTEEEKDEY